MNVVLWMAISLNGMIATDDNKEDFLSDANWTEFVKAVKKRGCLIWGRKTYENIKTWNASYLKSLEGVTKVVVSRNRRLEMDEGFIRAESPQKALMLLQTKGFKEVVLTGGAVNNASFAKANLIDEVILDVEGVIIGKGIPLFKQEPFALPLELIKIKKVTKNLIQLHYKTQKQMKK